MPWLLRPRNFTPRGSWPVSWPSSEEQYGERTHTVLDGFDEAERDNILAKALGYYDGLMFAVAADDPEQVNDRLETFVSSSSCRQ